MKSIKLVIENTYLIGYDGNNKACCYYPLTKEAEELDLPLLPNPFEEEAHVEKLAIDRATILFSEGESSANWRGCVEDFMVGYKTAQSKQFSLEDIQKAFEAGVAWHVKPNISELDAYTNLIQSLPTQQFPKEFITNKINTSGCSKCTDFPCQDIDHSSSCGFKWSEELKTITNSEGKEMLVGTYKY